MAVDAITGGLAVADDAIKFGLQKDQQLNTPAAVAAKGAGEVQALKDAIMGAIEKDDLDEIRRLCA